MNAKIVELLKKKKICLIEIKISITPAEKNYLDGLIGWERNGKASCADLLIRA